MKCARLFLTVLLLGAASYAQVVSDYYIVQLEGRPAASEPRSRLQARSAEIRGQQLSARKSIEQSGAVVLDSTQVVLNALMVRIPAATANRLSAIPGVARVYPVHLYHPSLDHALPLHHIPDAWSQIGGIGSAGLGMRIAIIDSGIDAQHPGFQDPSLPALDGFPRVSNKDDLAYTNSKIIVARTYVTTSGTTYSAHDDLGHGTAVGMLAAGVTNGSSRGTITGVAPKAYLGSYKVFPDSKGAPDSLIIKAIDDAVADGMDVLNLSLGSLDALRPQDDPVVQAVENAVSAGRIVTISAGNNGPDPNTIASPATAPNGITAGSMNNDRIFSGSLQLGGSSPIVAVPADGPNAAAAFSGPLVDIAALDPTALACDDLPDGSLTRSIALILRGTCTFEVKLNNAARAGAIAAVIATDAARPDAVAMTTDSATLPAAMVSYQDGVAVRRQIADGPTAAILDFRVGPVSVNAYRVSTYSAQGPNSDAGIKPDLISVGSDLLTAAPDGYAVLEGTSFSSPIVAGAAALLKASRPGLTVAQYRSLLINGASTFDNPAPIQQTGAGYLNVLAALQSTAVAFPTSLSFGIGANDGAGSVSLARLLTLTNIGPVSDVFSVSVTPLSGSLAPAASISSLQLDPGQSQEVTIELAGSRLDPGAYQGYVLVRGAQSPVTARIPYWYGIPSPVAGYVTILRAPTVGKAFSTQRILYRITDSQGIALNQTAKVSFLAGTGSVVSTASVDFQTPGAVGLNVLLGPVAPFYVIRLEAGPVTRDITITGQ